MIGLFITVDALIFFPAMKIMYYKYDWNIIVGRPTNRTNINMG